MKKDINKKKTLIRVLIIIVLAFALLYAILRFSEILMDKLQDESFGESMITQETTERTTFYPADYEEDIMNDPLYISLNRYIEYSSGGVSILVTDGDFASLGDGAVFFEKYFDIVINGRYEEYPALFTDEYLDKKDGYDTVSYNRSKFTMQKLFDIKVELLNETSEQTDEGKIVHGVFAVRYKILENNGTFRKDIGDDATYIPLIFETVTQNGETKINRVYTYYV